MRHLLLVPSLLLLLPAGAALARVDAGDVATSAGISASLYSTFKDDKRIIPAQDELTAFIASSRPGRCTRARAMATRCS